MKRFSRMFTFIFILSIVSALTVPAFATSSLYSTNVYHFRLSLIHIQMCIRDSVGNVNDVTITSIHNQWIGATYGWAFDLQSGGSLTATNTPTQVAGGYKVAWQNYTGSNRQVWNVDPF